MDSVEAIDLHKRAVFLWHQFGPYHLARCDGAAQALPNWEIRGLEIASASDAYAWDATGSGQHFQKATLFPNRKVESLSGLAIFKSAVAAIWRMNPDIVFLCHYQEPQIFALAAVCRLLGKRVIAMCESKFDDKPRRLFTELAKFLALLPYNGAMYGSDRTKAYLSFLKFSEADLFPGYNTVGVAALRQMTAQMPVTSFADRHFTIIARLVPKKNIGLALQAYAIYLAETGSEARELHICGSGECGEALQAQARDLGIAHKIVFKGFQQVQAVAEALVSSLALILPSTEEQFGLVINEALALNVPVLASQACGACDRLVRSGVNGYVFEPDNAAGLAHFMELVSDESSWAALSAATPAFAEAGAEVRFGDGVKRTIARYFGL